MELLLTIEHILIIASILLVQLGGVVVAIWRIAIKNKVWQTVVETRMEAIDKRIDSHETEDNRLYNKVAAIREDVADLRTGMARLETKVEHIGGIS